MMHHRSLSKIFGDGMIHHIHLLDHMSIHEVVLMGVVLEHDGKLELVLEHGRMEVVIQQ